MPKFEVLQGNRKEHESRDPLEPPSLRSLQGGKSRKEHVPQKEVVEGALINEKVFTKKEILEIIERIAEQENIKKSNYS